jgi:hypothetical protein
MPTIILRIGDEANKKYPVQLFLESADPDWQTKPVAESPIASPLPDGGGRWDAARVRQAVHGATENDQIAAGKYLYGLLASGDIDAKWKAARKTGTTTILDIAPKELRLLPWELLYTDHNFLALDPEQPLYRQFKGNGEPEECDALPLRVLVVIGAKDDDKGIAWQTELTTLRRFHRDDPSNLDMEELLRPSRQEIADVYRRFRPHVFHFIGHGYVMGGEAVLRIWNGKNYDDWTPTQITADLRGWRVPVAFINACRSAESAMIESSYDIAATFANLGTRCTITMQNDMDGSVAAGFARKLYELVAASTPLHVALAEARMAINRGAGMASDWPVPVLQMCCAPAKALPRERALAKNQSEEVIGAFAELGQFVDRTAVRRNLCSDAIAPGSEAAAKTLFVVHGSTGHGKTFLLQWCTRHFALRNVNVRNVNFADGNSKSFTEVMTVIRKGDEGKSLVTGRLDDAAFAAFDARLAQISATKAPVEDYVSNLSELFRQALTEIAERRPLMLCLDHLVNEALVAGDLKFLKEHLLDPLVNRAIPNVKVLLTISSPQLDGDLTWFKNNAVAFKVGTWDDDTFERLARAALDDLFQDDDASASEILAWLRKKKLPKNGWPPSFLSWARTWVKDAPP